MSAAYAKLMCRCARSLRAARALRQPRGRIRRAKRCRSSQSLLIGPCLHAAASACSRDVRCLHAASARASPRPACCAHLALNSARTFGQLSPQSSLPRNLRLQRGAGFLSRMPDGRKARVSIEPAGWRGLSVELLVEPSFRSSEEHSRQSRKPFVENRRPVRALATAYRDTAW